MENHADPSHFPFSHHGSGPGVDRSKGGPLPMKIANSDYPGSIAKVAYSGPDSIDVAVEIKDCSTILYVSTYSPEADSGILILMAAPISVGLSRIFAVDIPPGALSGKEKGFSFFGFCLKYCPWVLHLRNLYILDGDNVFLHAQDHYLSDMADKDWSHRRYFTPASSDLVVTLFRKWFYTKGNGGPFRHLERERVDLLPRRRLLDRYRFHVSECKVCQQALTVVDKAVSMCKFISRVCLVLTGALVLHGMQNGVLWKWRIAAGAVASALFFDVQRILEKKFIPQFYFVDYIHAEKN